MSGFPRVRELLLVLALGIAAALPASGAAEIGSEAGVQVDLNKRSALGAGVYDGRIYVAGGFGPHDEQMATLLVLEPTFPSPEAKPDVAGPIVSRPGEWHAAATMPEPAMAVSNVIGASSPAFGELGPVTTIIALAPCWRAAIAL